MGWQGRTQNFNPAVENEQGLGAHIKEKGFPGGEQ